MMDSISPEMVYNMMSNCPSITDLKEESGRDEGGYDEDILSFKSLSRAALESDRGG